MNQSKKLLLSLTDKRSIAVALSHLTAAASLSTQGIIAQRTCVRRAEHVLTNKDNASLSNLEGRWHTAAAQKIPEAPSEFNKYLEEGGGGGGQDVSSYSKSGSCAYGSLNVTGAMYVACSGIYTHNIMDKHHESSFLLWYHFYNSSKKIFHYYR